MLTIRPFIVNLVQENCYIVSDETHEAVIIDCGASRPSEYHEIEDYITTEGLTPVAHLLTHAHFDHILGAAWVEQRYGLQARCHTADLPLLTTLDRQYQDFLRVPFRGQRPTPGLPLPSASVPQEPAVASPASDLIHFGTHTLQVLPCPGHTPGGVCFYCEAENVLFSGDSLFRLSIGRTDLPGGHHWTLIRSLQHLLRTLPPDTTVYPGHGPETTIATEQVSNPYLAQ